MNTPKKRPFHSSVCASPPHKTQRRLSRASDIPTDIVCLITSFCEEKDIVTLLFHTSAHWRTIFTNPKPAHIEFKINFKSQYIANILDRGLFKESVHTMYLDSLVQDNISSKTLKSCCDQLPKVHTISSLFNNTVEK